MSETHAPLSTTARTNLKQKSRGRRLRQEGGGGAWPGGRATVLPFASERREAARLDVDAAVSVGLILMRRAGLHFGEALVGRDGVDLDPALPRLFLIGGGLKRGQAEGDGKGDDVNIREENHDIVKSGSSSGFEDPPGPPKAPENNTMIQYLYNMYDNPHKYQDHNAGVASMKTASRGT